MAKFVDADKLMESLVRKKSGIANQRYTEGFNDALMRFRSMLSKYPTADVVEVVRCKDCKKYFRIIGRDEREIWGCRHMGITVKPNDFCSYGEGRSENENT